MVGTFTSGGRKIAVVGQPFTAAAGFHEFRMRAGGTCDPRTRPCRRHRPVRLSRSHTSTTPADDLALLLIVANGATATDRPTPAVPARRRLQRDHRARGVAQRRCTTALTPVSALPLAL
jgi:hypothetical protein